MEMESGRCSGSQVVLTLCACCHAMKCLSFFFTIPWTALAVLLFRRGPPGTRLQLRDEEEANFGFLATID